METLSYKGYIGSLRYSKEDKTFCGKIEMIRSLVTFEADNAADLESAFQEAVEDYLATCKEQGITPEKPFKGVFNVRIRPELHKAAYEEALRAGVSLNKFVESSIANALLSHGV
jgi:predicted HicB family RNase H-like nuclease